MSRRSPAIWATRSECKPAQLMMKSTSNTLAVVAANQPAFPLVQAIHARARDHLDAAPRKMGTAFSRQNSTIWRMPVTASRAFTDPGL